MDADLAAFEEARSNRALRTDYDGHHVVTVKGPNGPYEVAAPDSLHAQRDRHLGTAADLARAYVKKHPELATQLGAFDIDELVALIDMFRERGNEERRIEVDVWLMGSDKFPPQHVGVYAEL